VYPEQSHSIKRIMGVKWAV